MRRSGSPVPAILTRGSASFTISNDGSALGALACFPLYDHPGDGVVKHRHPLVEHPVLLHRIVGQKKAFYSRPILQVALSSRPAEDTSGTCLPVDRWKLTVRTASEVVGRAARAAPRTDHPTGDKLLERVPEQLDPAGLPGFPSGIQTISWTGRSGSLSGPGRSAGVIWWFRSTGTETPMLHQTGRNLDAVGAH